MTSKHFSIIAIWLPHNCLSIAWCLPDDCLISTWWPPDDSWMTTARDLHDDFIDDCLRTILWLLDNWCIYLPDDFLTTPLHICKLKKEVESEINCLHMWKIFLFKIFFWKYVNQFPFPNVRYQITPVRFLSLVIKLNVVLASSCKSRKYHYFYRLLGYGSEADLRQEDGPMWRSSYL